MAEKSKKKGSGTIADELYFWAQALVFALVIMITISVFFFRLSGVDGSSMEPTLHHRDQVLMRIIGYDEPDYGDIVVVRAPGYPDEPLVKRVIAKGGDTIDINRATGNVVLNGTEMVEPYTSENIRNFGDQEYPYLVPEGHVFVIGDNRNASRDSRWSKEVGAMPYEHIVGKVLLRMWPLNQIGAVE